jgi:DNA-binding CsgD family transcriptional regulator
MLGKTVFDLNNTIMKGKWPKGFAEYIHRQDELVAKKGKPIKIPGKIFLNNAGFIVIHSMVKFPIFNAKQKVDIIMTFSFDSTQTENIETLYSYYKDHYSSEDLANQKFLEYIEFGEGNWIKLTTREIDCLIALVKSRNMKEALRFLGGMKEGTLKSHIEKIKLKTGLPNKQMLLKVFIKKCPCRILI